MSSSEAVDVVNELVVGADNNDTSKTVMEEEIGASTAWTVTTVTLAIGLFIASGFGEVGGGWLVWKSVRDKKPWWWAVLGSIILVIYGFLPTLQPTNEFGRIYAVYGGFFIVLSFLAGWALDGDKPDMGDVVGGIISLAGVLLILFWPRK